jgi:hypothetical protein
MGSAEGTSRKGQASNEFLSMFSASLLVLLVSVGIFFMYAMEARAVEDALQATSLCLKVSSTMGSFMVMGEGAEYGFSLPPTLNYRNYSVWVNSERGEVKVNYADKGVACDLHNRNVVDAGGNRFFELEKNATLVNKGEVIWVG